MKAYSNEEKAAIAKEVATDIETKLEKALDGMKGLSDIIPDVVESLKNFTEVAIQGLETESFASGGISDAVVPTNHWRCRSHIEPILDNPALETMTEQSRFLSPGIAEADARQRLLAAIEQMFQPSSRNDKQDALVAAVFWLAVGIVILIWRLL